MNESSISQTEADARSRCSRVKLLINCPRARDSTPSGRIDVRLIKTLQRLAGKHLKPSLRISATSRSTDFACHHHRDGKNRVCKVEDVLRRSHDSKSRKFTGATGNEKECKHLDASRNRRNPRACSRGKYLIAESRDRKSRVENQMSNGEAERQKSHVGKYNGENCTNQ